MDQPKFLPLGFVFLQQHLLHLFRKRPSGCRVLPRDQVTRPNNLRLWMHNYISGRSKTQQKGTNIPEILRFHILSTEEFDALFDGERYILSSVGKETF